MPGFDIATLVQFEPPVSRCLCCLALWNRSEATGRGRFDCPGCSATYLMGWAIQDPVAWQTVYTGLGYTGYVGEAAGNYTVFPMAGVEIDLGSDPLDHARTLAERATQLRGFTDEMPPLRGLMHLLLGARSFVHLTTFGMDLFMLGMLETIAQLVPVYVLASGLDAKFIPELEKSTSEAPGLNIRVGGRRGDPGDQNHGKLMIVDGILAVTGSANFTYKAWRKAADRREIVDVVTDVDRVRQLNNEHFAPLWVDHPDTPVEPVTAGVWTVTPPGIPVLDPVATFQQISALTSETEVGPVDPTAT